MKNLYPGFLYILLLSGFPPVVSAAAEAEVLYWVAPMDANYRRDKPGKSHYGYGSGASVCGCEWRGWWRYHFSGSSAEPGCTHGDG